MKPVFRVFVSSTFADLRDERNALQRGAFLNLEQYCEERGARFQAIDLRWGVSSDASLDQRGMEICLQELDRSQRLSPRPNFLVLVGNRYGSQPAPYEIEWREFSEIYEELPPSEKNLLNRWYQRDDNSLPASAVLQARTGRYENDDKWYEEEKKIRDAFLMGITSLGWPSDDGRRNKYEHSATHQEITAGALAPDSTDGQVFVYQRKILLGPYSQNAPKYQDLDGKNQIDGLLTKLREVVPPSNIRTLNSLWFMGKPRYSLAKFSAQVEADLKEVIDKELERLRSIGQIQLERQAHEAFGEERRKNYTGRRSQLDECIERVQSVEHAAPLILSGESGSGKTAFMAQLSFELANQQGTRVITRYVGATPASSDVDNLLLTIASELREDDDSFDRLEISRAADTSRRIFEHLESESESYTSVILIDALDQLEGSDHPNAISWIPDRLPNNVRLIVSVLERPGEMSGRACDRLLERFSDDAIMAIEPLGSQDWEALLNLWLADEDRQLTQQQFNGIIDRAKSVALPLYLKLAFEDSLRWRSYQPASETYEPLPYDIRGLIAHRFDDLGREANHGATLVSLTLGWLAAAHRGLTEPELLQLLARNDDFYDELLSSARHPLPGITTERRRIPIILWSRLVSDLAGYLTQRSVDDEQAYIFYHRLVGEVAAERHLTALSHQAIGEYFQEQPFAFGPTPNLRKLTEEAEQHLASSNWSALSALLLDKDYIPTMKAARRFEAAILMFARCYSSLRAGTVRQYEQHLPEALLSYILNEENSQESVDIEYIHALLVYRQDLSFYRSFLEMVDSQESPPKATPSTHYPRLRAEFRRSLADRVRRDGDLARAASIFEQLHEGFAARESISNEELRQLSILEYDLGYIAYLRGEFEESSEWMLKSIDSAEQAKHWYGYWHTKCSEAVHRFRVDHANGDEVLTNSSHAQDYFAQYSESRCQRGVLNTLSDRFDVYFAREDADDCEETFRQLSQAPWLVDNESEGDLLPRRAQLASLRGDHDRAIDLYQRHLASFDGEDTNALESYARKWVELGDIYRRANRTDESGEAYKRALAMRDEPGNRLYKTWAQAGLNKLGA